MQSCGKEYFCRFCAGKCPPWIGRTRRCRQVSGWGLNFGERGREIKMLSYGFFLDLAIILLLTKLLGLLTKRISLPQVVGAILAGLLIGPSCFNIVHESDFIAKMAEIGVIMLMFTAGLETDLQELKKTGLAALVIAVAGVAVSLGGGWLVYSLFYGFSPAGSPEFIESIFVGVILTATSVSITVETLRELGKLKGRVGTAILGAAIIDDIIGIVVLTFVIGMKDSSASSPVQVIISTVCFFIFVLLIGFGAHILFQKLEKNKVEQRRIPILGLVFCLLLSYVAEHFFGVADITGAFFAGIILCNIRSTSYIVRKIDVTSYMIFGPIFFASIGINTNLREVGIDMLWFTIILTIVGLLTKVFGCGLAAKPFHFNNKDAVRIGVGMMSRGEVALIVAQKGASAGIIQPSLFAAVIVLVIVSTIATPIVLKMLYKNEPPIPGGEDGSDSELQVVRDIDSQLEENSLS